MALALPLSRRRRVHRPRAAAHLLVAFAASFLATAAPAAERIYVQQISPARLLA